MTAYTTIADATAAQDEPLTQALIRALRDNPLAMFEGATGAPRLQNAAISADTITRDKLVDAALNAHFATSTDTPQATTGTLTPYLALGSVPVKAGQNVRALVVVTFSNDDASRLAKDCNAQITIGGSVGATHDVQLTSGFDGTDYTANFATLALNHNWTATSDGTVAVTLKVSANDIDVVAENALLVVLVEGTG